MGLAAWPDVWMIYVVQSLSWDDCDFFQGDPHHYKDLVVQTCFMGGAGGARGRSTAWMWFPFSAPSGEYMFVYDIS